MWPFIIVAFDLKCFVKSFSSSILALFSFAGFFRKTFVILPSRFVWISWREEFGCTLMINFIFLEKL